MSAKPRRIPCVHGIDRDVCPLHALKPADRPSSKTTIRISVNIAPEVADALRENAVSRKLSR